MCPVKTVIAHIFQPMYPRYPILDTLNHAHSAVSFTMEVEENGMLPFLGVQLLNRAPCVETKVYVKPTNTGLLLHYHSHVDSRYKHGLLVTMLGRISQKSVNA